MKTELLALIDELVKSELYVTEGKFSAAKDAKRIRADIVALLGQPQSPEFDFAAKLKLEDLLARGYVVSGLALEKPAADGQPERGFITAGGFVGWWRDGGEAAPAAPAAPADMRAAAFQQHHRDSAELHRLCGERDQARKEKRLQAVEITALESTVSHLSRLVDHQSTIAMQAVAAMKVVQDATNPVDESNGDLDARVPYDIYEAFVDERVALAAALTLPLPADMHVQQLKRALPEIVRELKAEFAAVTGENPWK